MFRFATSTLFGLALTLGICGAAQAGGYGAGYSSYGHSYHAPVSYAPKYVPHVSYPKTYVNYGYSHQSYAPAYQPSYSTVIITKPAPSYGYRYHY